MPNLRDSGLIDVYKRQHIDIAGVAFTDSEYAKSRTATAFGVHLLCQFIENWLEKK